MPSLDLTRHRDDPRLLENLIEGLHRIYRDACLYQKYYGHRMTDYQRRNKVYEIALAIGTSGAIAAWPFWQSGIGQSIWTLFAGFIAILVVLKPFLQYATRIERYSKLYSAWGELYYTLESLLNEHEVVPLNDDALLKSFKDANKRIYQLQKDKDIQLKNKLIQKCHAEVRQEIIPLSSLPLRAKYSTRKPVRTATDRAKEQ